MLMMMMLMMIMMMRAHRAGYFMPNTSRFGSGPDQMPLFSLLRTGDSQASEELSVVPSSMNKSRGGSLSTATSGVNQRHCVFFK